MHQCEDGNERDHEDDCRPCILQVRHALEDGAQKPELARLPAGTGHIINALRASCTHPVEHRFSLDGAHLLRRVELCCLAVYASVMPAAQIEIHAHHVHAGQRRPLGFALSELWFCRQSEAELLSRNGSVQISAKWRNTSGPRAQAPLTWQRRNEDDETLKGVHTDHCGGTEVKGRRRLLHRTRMLHEGMVC